MKLQIYDNGGKSLDRYTIFKAYERGTRDPFGSNKKIFEGIGASTSGAGFYQHITAMKGPHLGKRIKFEDLDKGLQEMLKQEFK